MSKGHEQLQELVERLERGGDDERLDIVRRAQRFKRSWVELAEGIAKLKKSRAYERWGYASLEEYCGKELHIRENTMAKLTLSYGALREHAPEVLKRDGVVREIPPLDAVEYFAKAFRSDDEDGAPATRRLDAPKSVIDELRSAVFDEGSTVTALRKRFDPILNPKAANDEAGESLRKLKAVAERLAQGVQGVEGLSDARVARVLAVVEALVRDLDEMIAKAEPEKPRGKGKSAA
jgi:hypothetical protein